MGGFGDEHFDQFTNALRARQLFEPRPSPQEALSMLASMGHETCANTDVASLSNDSPGTPLPRLTMLAWRAVDDALDRYAQSSSARDERGMYESIEIAAAHLALIELLRNDVKA